MLDYAVLQQSSGGDAFVFGTSGSAAPVTVKVSGAGCAAITVEASVAPRVAPHAAALGPAPPPAPSHSWKAKVPGKSGGDCTITATSGKDTVSLEHVTYGDVW